MRWLNCRCWVSFHRPEHLSSGRRAARKRRDAAVCLPGLGRAFAAVLVLLAATASIRAGDSVSDYNVVWETPSRDSAGSMPLGNGDIGLNAWVTPDGDLNFYISKTDSWGDNGRLLKVGRMQLKCDPPLVTARGTFRQELDLASGTMIIQTESKGRHSTVRLWVDANHPVIHLTIESSEPIAATASALLWRTERLTLPSLEVSDVQLDRSRPSQMHAATIVEPDTVLTDQHGRIGWYHHNRKSIGPELTARVQGLAYDAATDPLLHRTFGAIVTADQATRVDDVTLRRAPAKVHAFRLFVLTRHPASSAQWQAAADALIAQVKQIPWEQQRRAHALWWNEFWARSWVRIENRPAAGGDSPANGDGLVVARAYHLQRFITACAGRGGYPIKFNGSIFTVPYPGRPGDADYRRWGPGYWWQNTRLPYISMCASGDFDLMRPLWHMYAGRVLEVSKQRTQRYFGHPGAFFPECIYFWGAVFSESYGWTPVEKRSDPLQQAGWHKWEWVAGPELVWMMLDNYAHTLDVELLNTQLLPTANAVLTFFERHYKTDAKGKLVMHPSQSLETWWDCTNPMPELAGLHAVIERLLQLPAGRTSAAQRAAWLTLQKKLPPLPTRQLDGVDMLAPAERFANKRNIENPELYAVFPFRMVAFEKANVHLGIEALKHRTDRGNAGWRQDDIFMAYLGLADQAWHNVVGRARKKDPQSRFPAFWGPNYDWVPDQDHGGVLMKAVQAMLMQTDGRKIYLLPAWPRQLDVDFKLHAPYQTTVEATVRDGKVVRLQVTPADRRNDVTVVTEAGRLSNRNAG